jgi:LAO/AO transport system kinase
VRTQEGRLQERRRHQALAWMWERIDVGLKQAFRQDKAVRRQLPDVIDQVEQARLPASTAARRLLAAFQAQEMDPGSGPG